MAGLPRDVLKWLQSLDLLWQVKTPKWDYTNGYLIAEIFSWYFPQEIEMHMYYNGTSLETKQKNWFLLKNFFKRHKFNIPESFVEGTIHCKQGAGPLLLERIYEILSNRPVRKVPSEYEIDFTDRAYQCNLPMHARSTASQSIKNNVRITEQMADKSILLEQHKSQHIIDRHLEYRMMERIEDPARFDRKPTLAELCPRRAPTSSAESGDRSRNISQDQMVNNTNEENDRQQSGVHFKEVQVKQPSVAY